MRISSISILTVIIFGHLPTTAHAQANGDGQPGTPSNRAHRANVLNEEGIRLGEQEKYSEACAKFSASLDVAPRPDVRFNLAVCLKYLRQPSRARMHAIVAADELARIGDHELEELARALIAELEQKLVRLIVQIPERDRTKKTRILLDGQPVAPTMFAEPVFLEPGKHTLAATASGRRPFSAVVTGSEGETIRVAIVMEAAPRVVAAKTKQPSGSRRRLLALTMGGTGMAAVATGLGFGLMARSSWHSAFDGGLCDRDTKTCSEAGLETTNQARTQARAATILTGMGLALAGTGVYLWLTRPDSEPVEVVPIANAETVGAAVSGHF